MYFTETDIRGKGYIRLYNFFANLCFFRPDAMDETPKTFSAVISFNSRRLKMPRWFSDRFYPTFTPSLRVESPGGTPYPATVVVEGNTVYLETDTSDILVEVGADGPGAPRRREAQVTYQSSKALFTVVVPMSSERIHPRTMRHQPRALQVQEPDDVAGAIVHNPQDGDEAENPIELE